MKANNELKSIQQYQELTFKKLDELIQKECKNGSSKLYFVGFEVGPNMKRFLQDKGFYIYTSTFCYSQSYISW
jgi:hypothetical protein